MDLKENVCLKCYTTLGAGGLAKYLVEVSSVDELQKVLSLSKKEKLPFIVIGKGSNTLFDDRGYNGIVVVNKIQSIQWRDSEVQVGSGYSFSLLGIQSAKKGFAGLEFACGIPATVGGAIFMNAGAGGQETFGPLHSVEYLDEEGNHRIFFKNELEFSYRQSSFQHLKGVIVSAVFKLKPCLEARNKQLNIIEYRTKTQPYNEKSAGCMFRNPEGISAGALIEKLGMKGFQMGGAAVSLKHANFIINQNGASAKDVLDLVQYIQNKVMEETGQKLEMEVRKIPYDKG